MATVKIVQMMCASSEEYESWQYLDSQGRIWFQESTPDEDKCEYNEDGRRTKSVYKTTWKQLNLPDEPTNT
jgi:hypothetical protein